MTIVHPETLDHIRLARGAHQTPEQGTCLLEAVAYVAGEPHSDHPECVCPVLAAFGRAWNDALDDDSRNRILAPFVCRLVGTRSTAEVQDARAFMAADWAVRTFTPAWLRRAGLDADAVELEQLPELTSTELCRAAMPIISKARASAAAAWDAAGAAARAAAGDAAWAAAWDAARAAARDAAWAAARAAAGDAAWDAAWAAAWDAAWAAAGAAAWAAAGDAAGAALADTVTELQASAADLFDRMIRVGQP